MIIDRILDRKDDTKIYGKDIYNAREFYYNIMEYGEIGYNITRAMDYGEEKDIKQALCKYIIDNEYNPSICDYINSVNWLE